MNTQIIDGSIEKETVACDQSPALPQQNAITGEVWEGIEDTMTLPEWKVSGIFSSHMVLQRERPITIWGWSCHIGTQVTAVWEDETVLSAVSEDGRFEVTFTPRATSFEPSQMVISSDYGKTVFTDILVGDVWVIGGQSNAEHNLYPCLGDAPEIAESISEEHPFRLFTQTQAGAFECTQYHNVPARDIIKAEWTWNRPDFDTAKDFSAIGYFFARLLTEHIHVPVGIVMMCAGGACLRELMPVELAHERGYTTGANVPVGGYYNTLIAPLIGLQFRGQIFFQGESEGIWKEMALSYDEDLAAFVEDERRRFGFHFSFYNIQLSSYREECDAYFKHLYWVRSRQYRALGLIPNSYLVVSRDLGSRPGEPDFAHSIHKYALAKRVTALALAGDYGVGDLEEAYSPLPVSAFWEDNEIVVTFCCVNGGLIAAEDATVTGFSFSNEEGTEIPTAARIVAHDAVKVVIPQGIVATEVHFAMNNMAYLEQADLCGGSGLPVPAFVLPIESSV